MTDHLAAPAPAQPPVHGWYVIIPVKEATVAKSRLATAIEHLGGQRAVVSRGIAEDTIAAARACPLVARVVVVTSDPVIGPRWAAAGAAVVADTGTGLNDAIARGLAQAPPGAPAAVLLGDLPALTPGDLATALATAADHDQAVVPDTDGSGTVLRTSTGGGERLTPRFGADSAGRHVLDGALRLELDLPRLRTDVDDLTTLRAALALGVGPMTTAALEGLDLLGWDPCRPPSTTSTPTH